MGHIECIVTADKGIQYGYMMPNPDPTKPPIDMRRLYEKGERVMIREEDFVDFDELNKTRNRARGYDLEVSYRRVAPTPAKPVSVSGIDLEAIKAQLKAEIKAEMERDAIRGHNPVSTAKGK